MPLLDFKVKLETLGMVADVRGSGSSQFLYATNKGRVIELSRNNGQWWAEYWAPSDDDSADPLFRVSAHRMKMHSKKSLTG